MRFMGLLRPLNEECLLAVTFGMDVVAVRVIVSHEHERFDARFRTGQYLAPRSIVLDKVETPNSRSFLAGLYSPPRALRLWNGPWPKNWHVKSTSPFLEAK